MSENTEMITIFRSADATAREDAEEIQEVLAGEGIPSILVDDSTPGVVCGSVEVRVAAADAARAEALVDSIPVEGDMADADPSAVLDPVTVYTAASGAAESEALAIEGMLIANGIQPIRVQARPYPNLPVEIQVAREFADQARRLIEEARLAGAEAAEEEEKETESQ
jgi:hypothetical protein